MTGKHKARELSNMEVLAARLLHDVASSVGSVVSYVECVLEDPESEEIRDCLEEALESMISRFRLIRQAYSPSEDNSSFDNTKDHVAQYLKKRGLCLNAWNIDFQFSNIEIVEKVNRLVAQAILYSAMVMVGGKGISVTVSKSDSSVSILLSLDTESVSIHKDIEDMLSSEGNCSLTTYNVQAYFVFLLCKEYGAEFKSDTNGHTVVINLPLHGLS